MNVHSGQKEYRCELCVYATSHKSNLERHCSRLHGANFSLKSRKVIPKTRTASSIKDETDQGEDSSGSEISFDQPRKSFPKPRLCAQLYRCSRCDSQFHSQVEHANHTSSCTTAQDREVDESVVMAALALTQLRYGVFPWSDIVGWSSSAKQSDQDPESHRIFL